MTKIKVAFLLILTLVVLANTMKPHIVIVVADDLGFNDIGYHNSVIPTPFLDQLSSDGIRLENYYVHPVCTPSRAALLTGRYAHNTGLVGPLIGPNPYGLEENIETLPQILKKPEQGNYSTHMVGKWHLGHSRPRYLPTGKGFDTFYGSLLGACGYYSKFVPHGYDLHNATSATSHVVLDTTHYTELMTQQAQRIITNHAQINPTKPMLLYVAYTAAHSPLEAEEEDLKMCSGVVHPFRKQFCGLVVGIDRSVERIVSSLVDAQMWDDTVLIFTTDNGGNPWEGGSNYPLRGTKVSVFQGGVRGVAFIAGGKNTVFYGQKRVHEGLMHISDWAPTIVGLSSSSSSSSSGSEGNWTASTARMDGWNMMEALVDSKRESPRKEVVLHIDPYMKMGAVLSGKYKYIEGRTGDQHHYSDYSASAFLTERLDDQIVELIFRALDAVMGRDRAFFYHEIVRNIHERIVDGLSAHSQAHHLLFDVDADPLETRNVADQHSDVVEAMAAKLGAIKAQMAKPHAWHERDPLGKPKTNRLASHPHVAFHVHWLSDTDSVGPTVDAIKELEARIAKVVVFVFLATFLVLAVAVRTLYASHFALPATTTGTTPTLASFTLTLSPSSRPLSASLSAPLSPSSSSQSPIATQKLISKRKADLINVVYRKPSSSSSSSSSTSSKNQPQISPSLPQKRRVSL